MKKNIFILALVAMFVSSSVMAATAAPKKAEVKKECCKDGAKSGDKACCKEGAKGEAKACKDGAKGDAKACCKEGAKAATKPAPAK
ncbi:MAG: hypothetical protein ACOYM7_02370 [Paludibacter sp.]